MQRSERCSGLVLNGQRLAGNWYGFSAGVRLWTTRGCPLGITGRPDLFHMMLAFRLSCVRVELVDPNQKDRNHDDNYGNDDEQLRQSKSA